MLDDVSEKLETGKFIDVRPINILLEHRKVMYERLRKIASLDFISYKVVEDFLIQVQECEKFRNRVFLYNVRQSEKDIGLLIELQKKLRNVYMPNILDSI